MDPFVSKRFQVVPIGRYRMVCLPQAKHPIVDWRIPRLPIAPGWSNGRKPVLTENNMDIGLSGRGDTAGERLLFPRNRAFIILQSCRRNDMAVPGNTCHHPSGEASLVQACLLLGINTQGNFESLNRHVVRRNLSPSSSWHNGTLVPNGPVCHRHRVETAGAVDCRCNTRQSEACKREIN